jgi:hypothetical protein
LRPEPFTEYLHGTFFFDKTGEYVLVQFLNTVEGEYRAVPRVRINVDSKRLNVTGARLVWPHEQDVPVHSGGGRTEVVIENPPGYGVLYLRLGQPVRM